MGSIIFIILIAILVLGLILLYFDSNPLLGSILSLTGIIFLSSALITLPVQYYIIKSELVQFERVRTTLVESRSSLSDIERAAMIIQIADKNQWLEGLRYWNDTIFEYYILDTVDTTPMIQLGK